MKNWQKFLITVVVLTIVFWLADDYETVVGGIFQAIWAILAGAGVYSLLDYFEGLGTYLADRRFMKINGREMIKVDGIRFKTVTDAKIYIRTKYEGWNR